MNENGQTLEQIRDGLVAMFGDKLPDIEQEPLRFAYYLKLYFYEGFVNEQRNDEIAAQQTLATEGSVREETVENSEGAQLPDTEIRNTP
jgi:hypothetical protein